MSIIGRARPPEPAPSADEQIVALVACHDQAVALIHELLVAGRTASPGRLVDGLLDLRNILQPPKDAP